MERREVAPFALTYRQQMTGELGFTRQAGYEFWQVFAEQGVGRFGPTHETEKSLTQMGFVKYHGDIAKFLLKMENLNIHTWVTTIARRKMIEDQIPEHSLRRLSLREDGDDGKWLEAVKTITRAEEDFRERKSLRGGGPCGTTRAEKMKFEDSKPMVAGKRVKSSTRLRKRRTIRRRRLGREG